MYKERVMKAQYIMSFMVVMMMYAVQAETKRRVSCVDKSFADFVHRCVPQEHLQGFCLYYERLMKKMEAAPSSKQQEGKQKATYDFLIATACKALSQEHQDWYGEIEPLLTKKVVDVDSQTIKEVNHFLIRYGAYIEYRDKVLPRETASSVQFAHAHETTPDDSWWHSFKNYVFAVGDKVASFFGTQA